MHQATLLQQEMATLAPKSTHKWKTQNDAYPHSDRELLCSSGQIVVLCFESFTLTVKDLPLYTPFCEEKTVSVNYIAF